MAATPLSRRGSTQPGRFVRFFSAAATVGLLWIGQPLALAGHAPFACAGDIVWEDDDSDGLQDAGEPGVAGVSVVLFDADANRVATTITDDSGRYRFGDLTPGTYTVLFETPDGYELTQQRAGDDPTIDSDPDPTSGETDPIVLEAGDLEYDIDAGLVRLGPPEPRSTAVGDTVWLDENQNGLQDHCEPGVAGVSVVLLDADANRVATTITDDSGRYRFGDLAPGTYTVLFETPDGYELTQQRAGDDPTIDSDPDSTSGETDPIVLEAGDLEYDVDAGLVVREHETTTTEPSTTTVLPTTSIPPTTTSSTVLGTTTTTPSATTTAPAATTTTRAVTPTTSPPTSTETTLSPQQRLEDLVGGLTPGALEVGESHCRQVGAPSASAAGPARLQIECTDLIEGDEFFLVVVIQRSAPDEESGIPADSSPDETDTTSAPTKIETSFRMRATLSFVGGEVAVRPLGEPSAVGSEATVTRDVLEGREISFEFAVLPTRVEGSEGRLVISALAADDDATSTEVATAVVTLRTATQPSPSRSTTAGGALTSTTVAEAPEIEVPTEGAGAFPLWLGALGGLALLGGWAGSRQLRARSAGRVTAAEIGEEDARRAVAVGAASSLAQHRLFISYAREDSSKVDRLQRDLEKAGFATWVDRGDITGGEVWKSEIVQGIRESDAVILVLSEHSVRSSNVAAELSLGRSNEKPVFPVRLVPDVVLSDRLAYDTADVQFVDLFGDRSAGVQKLIDSVRHRLGSLEGDIPPEAP